MPFLVKKNLKVGITTFKFTCIFYIIIYRSFFKKESFTFILPRYVVFLTGVVFCSTKAVVWRVRQGTPH